MKHNMLLRHRQIIHYKWGHPANWSQFRIKPLQVQQLLVCIEEGLQEQVVIHETQLREYGEWHMLTLCDAYSGEGYKTMVNSIWQRFSRVILHDDTRSFFDKVEDFCEDAKSTLRYMREWALANWLGALPVSAKDSEDAKSDSFCWSEHGLPCNADIATVFACIRQALLKIPPPQDVYRNQYEEIKIPKKDQIKDVLRGWEVLRDFAVLVCKTLEERQRAAFAESLLASSSSQRGGVPLEIAQRIASQVPLSHLWPLTPSYHP
jgi:hypothetical protein